VSVSTGRWSACCSQLPTVSTASTSASRALALAISARVRVPQSWVRCQLFICVLQFDGERAELRGVRVADAAAA